MRGIDGILFRIFSAPDYTESVAFCCAFSWGVRHIISLGGTGFGHGEVHIAGEVLADEPLLTVKFKARFPMQQIARNVCGT